MSTNPTGSMGLLEHLGEFRKRLLFSLVVLAVASVACLTQVKIMWQILLRPMPGDQLVQLINVAPTEALVIDFKISILAGLIVSSPILFYQFYAFLAPGLYQKEKKAILPVAFIAAFFFAVGILFSYLVVIPTSLAFLSHYAQGVALQNWTQVSYSSFVLRMLLVFALMFQLPVVVYFLARLHIVTAGFLWSQFRVALLIIMTLSAMLTPPEVISMLLLSAPMILLYLLGIGVARVFNPQEKPNV